MSAESPIQPEEFVLNAELLKHNQRIQREILAICFPKKEGESEEESLVRENNSLSLILRFSGDFRESFKRRILGEEGFLARCENDLAQVAREFILELGIEAMAEEIRMSESAAPTSSESLN